MERLPGFRDFYPEPLPHEDVWSTDARNYLFQRWRETARRYGFREYDGPPLEPLELYTTKSGDEIVRQLYHFVDKGDREVALRPEMTPTLARMVAAHARNYKKPIKWFAIPQLFRYEKQQKGRLREHFQFNADIFGENARAADAEIIALLIDSLQSLGLTARDLQIRLSSRNAWQEYFSQRNHDHTKAYAFYQVIDKLEREDPEHSAAQLRSLGFSIDEIRQFIQESRPTPELQEILENLVARGLGDFVHIDYNVIRGLAYYTGPVFEAFDRKGEFRAIAGGGRYDHLVKVITGGRVEMEGLGFGMGDVVLLELLKARNLLPAFDPAVDVYCLIEDEALRTASLGLIQELRTAGISVDYALTATKADRQFKRALELKARYTVRVEPGDGPAKPVRVRHLATREESLVPATEVATRLGAARG